ncbi:tripartite tricarboxylate transporter TctB family protein [Natrinema versiforme]|uniref:Tripartite tricarboxylate transporter TctB family protein n=1 Tax=Natrinema versiforme TaxID=88724 RepID=A0A4P8WM90_9EURY|nr:tripartite tricarboxylate transporter TctB family protein [Natrinema versiforme]QCS44697.1 tripartite tricarboxylate transporter TctB family protein [Natrinema versiforme]
MSIEHNTSGVFHRLKDNIDVLIVLLFFIYLGTIVVGYPQTARVFPLIFIAIGVLALTIELVTNVFLPKPYRDSVQQYTQGLSGNVESSFTESYDDNNDNRNELADLPGITLNNTYRIALISLLIIGYGISTYLIGFLPTIPLFTFSAIYLIGSKSLTRAILMTIILMVFIYILFGELMNVPIFEAQLRWF